MNNTDKLKEVLNDYIQGLSDRDLVDLHREYCQAMNYGDDEIYDIETFFSDFFCDVKDVYNDVICRIDYSRFKDCDDWAKFDCRGNIVSTSIVEAWIDIDDIVDHIIENDDDLSDTDIREILDDHESADDETEDE